MTPRPFRWPAPPKPADAAPPTPPPNPTTRRGILGAGAALFAVGATAAAPAVARTAPGTPGPDADLIRLCDRYVAAETEACLLVEHDCWAPDEGPNHARYEALIAQSHSLSERIWDCASPVTLPGVRAIARVMLTWIARDPQGNIECQDFGQFLTAALATGGAGDFVWPPVADGYAPPVAWFPVHRKPPRHADAALAVLEGEAPAYPCADPQETADAALQMAAVAWRIAQRKATEAGRRITLDTLRDAERVMTV